MDVSEGFFQLAVVGCMNSGHYFYMNGEIRIINEMVERLANFAAHWLEEDCGEPDWCEGQDVNADTVVNLEDYALIQLP